MSEFKLIPRDDSDKLRALSPDHNLGPVTRCGNTIRFNGQFRPDEPGEESYQEAKQVADELAVNGLNVARGAEDGFVSVSGSDGADLQTLTIRLEDTGTEDKLSNLWSE